MYVVIAGAGIMGCSLGLALTKRGCKVHILDPSPCSGATACSWAWLNANKKNPRHYKELNMKGMQEWSSAFPQLTHHCGSILLDDARPSLDSSYPCCSLTQQQLLDLEPQLSAASVSGRPMHHYAQESWVSPQEACSHMLEQAAAQQGGELLLRERVQHILTCPAPAPDSGAASRPAARVVGVESSSGRRLEADMVVLACGPGVQALAAQVGVEVPLLHKPARVTLTSALPPLLKAMVCSKDVFMMQRPDGTFLLGEPFESLDEDTSASVGQAMLARATQLLPALQQAAVESVQIGFRPYPKDGHPVVGTAAEGLYICTTHSGMTLAPYLAKLAAEEIVSRGATRVAELEPYRPQRSFLDSSPAYGWNLYHEKVQGSGDVEQV